MNNNSKSTNTDRLSFKFGSDQDVCKKIMLYATAIAAALPLPSLAIQVEELIVTAQKTAESVNEIGMSISAFSGDTLKELGVADTTDMTALTPGLTYTEQGFGPPVYNMRGAGFKDTSYNAQSTVGVYMDEAAVAYPIMTLGGVFDLERVEVLKGPQGSLYGKNSTGGAINYIANKPTEFNEGQVSLSYGNYDTLQVEGYVSGPLSDSVSARLALTTTQSGEGWQRNLLTGSKQGEKDKVAARFSLSADVTDRLTGLLQLGYWTDKSDSISPQVVRAGYQSPGDSEVIGMLEPYINLATPSGDSNDVAAWADGFDNTKDFSNLSTTLRFDYEVSDTITATSITNISSFEDNGTSADIAGFATPYSAAVVPADTTSLVLAPGTNITSGYTSESATPWLPNFRLVNSADIDTFSQEIRLSAEYETWGWLLGGYYSSETVDSQVIQEVYLTTNTNDTGSSDPRARNIKTAAQDGTLDVTTAGIFVNANWQLNDEIKLTAGLRYSEDETDYEYCARDDDGLFGPLFFGTEPGACVTLIGTLGEGGTFGPQKVVDSLKEDSVSGRITLNYSLSYNYLLYATYARGFKAGGFPNHLAFSDVAVQPVVQEQLDSFEIGFKSNFADGDVQFNGSLYRSDYKDKQMISVVAHPIFGALRTLTNVPDSKIEGAELSLEWQPVTGLYLSWNGSWVNTEVTDDFLAANAFAQFINYKGSPFTETPEFEMTGLINYETSLSNGLVGFVGADVSYSESSNYDYIPGDIIPGVDPAANTSLDSAFKSDSYYLVNLRVGVKSDDGRWSSMLWGRNITDEVYDVGTRKSLDAVVSYKGMPATYGVTFSYNFL